MDLGLKGKTAIVTGAASNIGRMIALTLAAEGANIVIADIDEEGAKGVAKECEAKGVKALPVKTDVTSQESVEAMVKKADDTFGRIDVLVNDAAIFITKVFLETEKPAWDKQINVNYYGTIYCCKAVIPYMQKQGGGRIISIGSDAGRVGENKQAVYSGTKAFVLAFSQALSRDLRPYKIKVSVLCPGFFSSDFFNHSGQQPQFIVKLIMLDSARVARAGIAGVLRGKTVIIPGLLYKSLNLLMRFLPRTTATWIADLSVRL